MPASGMRGLNDALDMCVGVANGRTGTPTLLVNEWLLEQRMDPKLSPV